MPTITSIKPQKNKKRVNVFLDGKFGFGLDFENIVKLGLKVEQELSEEEIEKIVKEGEFQKVYDRLLRFASLRPRSEKEIKDWLKRKKVHESIQDNLFNRLKRLELIDDIKFAKWWVDQRVQFKSKSKKELFLELRLKGIDKEIIDQILSESKHDEYKAAKKLFEKKKYMWKKFDGFTARKKVSDYLARKGFSWETIKKLIDATDQKR